MTTDKIRFLPDVDKTVDWRQPEPIGSISTAGPFPVAALPPVMRDMVRAVAGNKQVPEELPALLGLTAISTLAAPHFQIHRDGGWIEPLNIYAAVVMESGTGKTPAEKDVIRPLWDIEKHMRDQYICLLDSKIDELDATRPCTIASDPKVRAEANRIEDKIKELQEAKRRPPDLITGSDITVEVLSSLMSRQGGAASIIDSEGEFFGIMSGRYSGGVPNLGIALKAYDGDRYRVRRIGREQDDIERAILTLGLCVQPVVLRDAVKLPALVERGLLARFLFAWPRNLLGTRADKGATYNHDAMEAWEQALRAVCDNMRYDHGRNEDELPSLYLSEGAIKRHVEFCGLVERRLHPDDGDLGNMSGWAAKHKARALRIAGLLHFVSGEFVRGDRFVYEVGEETIRAALEISMWAIGHAVKVFGATDNSIEVEDQQCVDVIRWMQRARPDQFGTREVMRGCRKKWLSEGGVAALTKVMNRLVEDGYVMASTTTNRAGHVVAVYQPNPLISVEAA